MKLKPEKDTVRKVQNDIPHECRENSSFQILTTIKKPIRHDQVGFILESKVSLTFENQSV